MHDMLHKTSYPVLLHMKIWSRSEYIKRYFIYEVLKDRGKAIIIHVPLNIGTLYLNKIVNVRLDIACFCI